MGLLVAVVLAVALAGCSGRVERGSAASSTAPAGAGAGAGTGGPVDVRFRTVTELAAAMSKQRLADRTEKITIDGAIKGEAVSRSEPAGFSARTTTTIGSAQAQVIILPQTAYLMLPPLPIPNTKPWLRVDLGSPPTNPNLALLVQQVRLIQVAVDPAALLAARTPASEIAGAEPAAVDGVPCVKYIVRTDRAKFSQTIADPNARKAFDEATATIGNLEDIVYWLDADNRVRRGEFKLAVNGSAQQGVIKSSGWGQPVEIVAPPPDQVMTLDELASRFPGFR